MNHLRPESDLDVVLLTNPAANRGRARVTGYQVQSYLEQAGHRVQHELPADVSMTYSMVAQAVKDQKRVIAVGGD